jgi:hypothetical protein
MYVSAWHGVSRVHTMMSKSLWIAGLYACAATSSSALLVIVPNSVLPCIS